MNREEERRRKSELRAASVKDTPGQHAQLRALVTESCFQLLEYYAQFDRLLPDIFGHLLQLHVPGGGANGSASVLGEAFGPARMRAVLRRYCADRFPRVLAVLNMVNANECKRAPHLSGPELVQKICLRNQKELLQAGRKVPAREALLHAALMLGVMELENRMFDKEDPWFSSLGAGGGGLAEGIVGVVGQVDFMDESDGRCAKKGGDGLSVVQFLEKDEGERDRVKTWREQRNETSKISREHVCEHLEIVYATVARALLQLYDRATGGEETDEGEVDILGIMRLVFLEIGDHDGVPRDRMNCLKGVYPLSPASYSYNICEFFLPPHVWLWEQVKISCRDYQHCVLDESINVLSIPINSFPATGYFLADTRAADTAKQLGAVELASDQLAAVVEDRVSANVVALAHHLLENENLSKISPNSSLILTKLSDRLDEFNPAKHQELLKKIRFEYIDCMEALAEGTGTEGGGYSTTTFDSATPRAQTLFEFLCMHERYVKLCDFLLAGRFEQSGEEVGRLLGVCATSTEQVDRSSTRTQQDDSARERSLGKGFLHEHAKNDDRCPEFLKKINRIVEQAVTTRRDALGRDHLRGGGGTKYPRVHLVGFVDVKYLAGLVSREITAMKTKHRVFRRIDRSRFQIVESSSVGAPTPANSFTEDSIFASDVERRDWFWRIERAFLSEMHPIRHLACLVREMLRRGVGLSCDGRRVTNVLVLDGFWRLSTIPENMRSARLLAAADVFEDDSKSLSGGVRSHGTTASRSSGGQAQRKKERKKAAKTSTRTGDHAETAGSSVAGDDILLEAPLHLTPLWLKKLERMPKSAQAQLAIPTTMSYDYERPAGAKHAKDFDFEREENNPDIQALVDSTGLSSNNYTKAFWVGFALEDGKMLHVDFASPTYEIFSYWDFSRGSCRLSSDDAWSAGGKNKKSGGPATGVVVGRGGSSPADLSPPVAVEDKNWEGHRTPDEEGQHVSDYDEPDLTSTNQVPLFCFEAPLCVLREQDPEIARQFSMGLSAHKFAYTWTKDPRYGVSNAQTKICFGTHEPAARYRLSLHVPHIKIVPSCHDPTLPRTTVVELSPRNIMCIVSSVVAGLCPVNVLVCAMTT